MRQHATDVVGSTAHKATPASDHAFQHTAFELRRAVSEPSTHSKSNAGRSFQPEPTYGSANGR